MDLGLVAFGGIVLAGLKNHLSNLYYYIKSKCFISLDIQYGQEEYLQFDKWLIEKSNYKSYSLRKGELVADRGSYWFLYKGKLIFAEKYEPSRQGLVSREITSKLPDSIFISVLFGGKEDLKDIINENKPPNHDGVGIYVSDFGDWIFTGKRQGRSASTVKMPDDILSDATWFFDNKNKYRELGVSHRRGYLFHGKPGTGKTSTILVIATELQLDIYVVPYEIDGDRLKKLIAEIPPRALVIFEDIDRIVCDGDKYQRSFDLASLLNAIDGVSDSDARLMIMTTNHKEKLDEALIRPGRCDKHYEFNDISYGEELRKKLER